MGVWKEGKREGHGELMHTNHKYVGPFKEDRVSRSFKMSALRVFTAGLNVSVHSTHPKSRTAQRIASFATMPRTCPSCSALKDIFFILGVSLLQPEGKGKYVFDIGCQQHGEYIPVEEVRMLPFLSRVFC